MLAYAPRPDRPRLSPTALTLIIGGHVAAVLAVMSARTMIERPVDKPLVTEIILPKPPQPVDKKTVTKPQLSAIDHPRAIVPPLDPTGPQIPINVDPLPPVGQTIGTGTLPIVEPLPPVDPPIVRTGPHLATAGESLRPPYPSAKREAGDEASLRLKLTIDERGRVIAVDPVGRVDPVFFEAARRHILRAWRYQPAMEGPKAVPSTTTITLKFELANA